MKMRMLLLVSAVALLVSPAAVSPHHIHKSDDIQRNLNRVYDLAEKCKASHTKQDFFVDDVLHLTEGSNKCGYKVFCKVHDILHNHQDLCKRDDQEELVRTLQMYNNGRNVNCEETPQGTPMTDIQVGLSRLLDHIMGCVQQRNLSGNRE